MLFFNYEMLIYNSVYRWVLKVYWMYLTTAYAIIASLLVLQFCIASSNIHINLEEQVLDLFFHYYVALKKSMLFVFP